MNPYFSIIIPTYNREKHISETIQSVLNQDFVDFELLVIDNQSQDSTKEIVTSFSDERIQFYLNDQNYERCYSRNRGIQLSRGTYVLLLDSDDLFEPDHLSNWHQFILSSGNRTDCFYVSDKKILKDSIFIQMNPVLPKNTHPVSYFFLNPIIPGQVCIPSVILKQFRFRNELLIFEDAALWMELALDYPVFFNAISSFVYRVHADNSVNEVLYNVYLNRLNAIRLVLKDKKINSCIDKRDKRKNLNLSIMGIIRHKVYNSKRISSFFWVLYAIIFFPDFSLKNKLLILISLIPLMNKIKYFETKNFF